MTFFLRANRYFQSPLRAMSWRAISCPIIYMIYRLHPVSFTARERLPSYMMNALDADRDRKVEEIMCLDRSNATQVMITYLINTSKLIDSFELGFG